MNSKLPVRKKVLDVDFTEWQCSERVCILFKRINYFSRNTIRDLNLCTIRCSLLAQIHLQWHIQWQDLQQASKLQDNFNSFLAAQRTLIISRVSGLPVNIMGSPQSPLLMADQGPSTSWFKFLLWFINKCERIVDISDIQSSGQSPLYYQLCDLRPISEFHFPPVSSSVSRANSNTEMGCCTIPSENPAECLADSRSRSLPH